MLRNKLIPIAAVTAGAAVLGTAGIAAAQTKYPPPTNPKATANKPKGPFKTLKVNKKTGPYKTIQKAVNAAKPGDTIRIANGTYKEGVKVSGEGKRYIKIIGNPASPEKVVLDGTGLKGAAAQQAIQINGANEVGLQGMKAKNYKANGFFAINVVGYTMDRLIAERNGVYGIYAFNSKGGTMKNSVAYYHNDAGFYIGQTPPQSKPVRSIVTNVQSWGNVLGFSGTNMRYVTITKSKWFNNGTGIVPNALDSEKFAPPEDNVIADNDVFWNNFNYRVGAPFPLRKSAVGEIPYPTGVGVLLFGGRDHIIEKNRFFGNWLVGAGMLQQLLLKEVGAQNLEGNQIKDNAFGKNNTDLNGRDLFYDGNGKDNCISGNTGVQITAPADQSTFAPCPFTGNNAFSSTAQGEAIAWATSTDPTASFVRHPHTPISGITPLETFSKTGNYGPKTP
ncbi:MAG: hypothetical protein JHC84_18290 [Solirubrobacteraceae bacterium]|nr:hypothetical protein [Solirubrobacteraceae bacterium]